MKKFFPLLLFVLALGACSSEDGEIYPSLITEMAMARGNSEGLLASFTTDSGHTYQTSNKVSGLKNGELLRTLISYVVAEDGKAQVYKAVAVPVLKDIADVETPVHDPTGVESCWLGGRFVNLHLLPKTQGGKQGWAFLRDSVSANTLGGCTFHLSLYHSQLDDAEAYSNDFYACVALDSVATAFDAADSIVFTVVSYAGAQQWHFGGLN